MAYYANPRRNLGMEYYDTTICASLLRCSCDLRSWLYCMQHRQGVCGDCILSHELCVVRHRSCSIVDTTFERPHRYRCCQCKEIIAQGRGEEGDKLQTVRLGCLDIVHVECLKELHNYYVMGKLSEFKCPLCHASVWPPTSIPNQNTGVFFRLKTVLAEMGFEGLDVVGEPPSPLDSFRNLWGELKELKDEIYKNRKAEVCYSFIRGKMTLKEELRVSSDSELDFITSYLPNFTGTVIASLDVTMKAYDHYRRLQPLTRIRFDL